MLLKEIDEAELLRKVRVHTNRPLMGNEARIVGLFIKDRRLGITLSSGCFVFMNSEEILVEDVHFGVGVQSSGVVGETNLRCYGAMEIKASEGMDNLSLIGNHAVVYLDQQSVDTCTTPTNTKITRVREITPSSHILSNTVFQESKQWICLSDPFHTQVRRLRLLDVVLIYLQIYSEQKSTSRS